MTDAGAVGDDRMTARGADGAVARKAPNLKLRQYVTGSWVAFIVLFTAVRVVVVRDTLQKYGLNIWVFGFIDLATAIPYAMGVARVVTSMIDRDRRNLMRWLVVAVASFLAPYLYVAWAGRDAGFPAGVWIALALLVTVFGGNAVYSAWRKVKRGRAARRLALAEVPPVDPMDPLTSFPLPSAS